MDRTQGANYDASTGVRLFKDGPPGTTVEYNWLNGVQEEMVNIIQGTAQTPSISNRTQVMQSIAMQGLGLRNGVIVPSVAGNNLTVAVKTLAGLDPSTTNPVYVRIGDTVRAITSALYLTVTGGTDDWDRTSYTFSLFVYLGYDSANQRVEILLCPQPTYLTYPAANPVAPEPRRLRSAYGANTGTAITNGHTMQVIGRVDGVVQSAADNFTGVTSTALSYPVWFTPVLASPNVPVKTNAADTTPIFTNNKFYYSINFNYCLVSYNFSGDGGTDGAGVSGAPLGLYMPFLGYADESYSGGHYIRAASFDGGNVNLGMVVVQDSTYYMNWYVPLVVAGSAVTELLPPNFTAGNRTLAGAFTYQILI